MTRLVSSLSDALVNPTPVCQVQGGAPRTVPHCLVNVRELFSEQAIKHLGMLDAFIQVSTAISIHAFPFQRFDCFPQSRPPVEEWVKS